MATMIVDCNCGQKIKVAARHAGKQVLCPKCKKPFKVPIIDLGEVSTATANTSSEPPAWDNMKQVMTWITLPWLGLTGVAVLVCAVSGLRAIFILLLLAVMVLALGMMIVSLFLAKGRAMSRHEKSHSVLFGFSKMILWEPTEGVVFLKNKQVHAVDNNPNDGGGIRYIFPVLGEQVGLRAPLTVQSTPFTDQQVFTKDYLPVTVRMTIWWRLIDLEKYYLSISEDGSAAGARHDWDGDGGSRQTRALQLGQAKSWILMMAESVGRQEFSKTSTAFLVASQISSELPTDLQQTDGSDESLKDTTQVLATRLESGIRGKVVQYGLDVDRVELQEVMLPEEIHAAAVEACSVAFLPAKAEREAAARKIQLQADVDMLGSDAVAIREVLGNAEGMSFLGVPDFLDTLFSRIGKDRRIADQEK